MESLIASLGYYVSLAVLGFSGGAHLHAVSDFTFAIQMQTSLTRTSARGVAAVVAVTEILLAATALAATVVGDRSVSRVTMIAIAGLFVVYTLYSSFLVRRRPGVPCGCSSDDISTSVWVIARAAALAGAAGAAALMPGRVAGLSSSADFVVVVLSAGAFAVLLWNLPGALHTGARVQPEVR